MVEYMKNTLASTIPPWTTPGQLVYQEPTTPRNPTGIRVQHQLTSTEQLLCDRLYHIFLSYSGDEETESLETQILVCVFHH